MIRRTLGSLVTAAACLAFPSVVSAEDRSGAWVGGGGGFGSSGVSCNECDDTHRETSGVAYLTGGWNLNPQTRIGGEYHLWKKSEALEEGFDGSVSLSQVSAIIAYYPSLTRPFFVKGGGGVAMFYTDVNAFGTNFSADGKGFGAIVGAGYDIPISERWSITPAVNFWFGTIGDIPFEGESIFGDWSHNIFDLTAGITFR